MDTNSAVLWKSATKKKEACLVMFPDITEEYIQ